MGVQAPNISGKYRGGQKSPLDTFTNCSAHRPPTEMILYSMERYCPQDSKKYETISVGGLRAEQFAIKIDIFYRENFRGVEKSRFKIILILFLYIQSRSGFCKHPIF